MEYEIDFRLSVKNEKWKMENGCSYSIFHFSLSMENENNGMYTDPLALSCQLFKKLIYSVSVSDIEESG